MAIPFDLIFEPKKYNSGAVGRVICNELDPVLHPSGEIRVLFESEAARSEDGTFLVESFQIQSLISYLMNQTSVRQTVETELSEARENWLRGWEVPAGGVWSDSKFNLLWLPCRKHNQFDGGGPETASMYILVFAVQWDDEHVQRTLKFRDDRFVSLGVDGD